MRKGGKCGGAKRLEGFVPILILSTLLVGNSKSACPDSMYACPLLDMFCSPY